MGARGERLPVAARWLRASWRKLPAGPYAVGWEPGVSVPGEGGVPLLTDHYFPSGEGASGEFPTLLVRSPYGRGAPWSALYGVLFAEQGFHVVVQSCRGTGGSGGTFHLWRNEAADGRATVAWLREQPWFNGALGTIGPSYLGYVQWALALDPPPELRAMVVQVGLHDPYAYFHAGGAVHLENALVTGVGMAYQHQGWRPFLRGALRLRRWLRGAHREPVPYASGPPAELPWLAEALARTDADDPYWDGASVAAAADRAAVPTCLISGWQDVFLDQNLAQYGRLRRAGCETALLIGPWTHTSALQEGWPEVFAESLAWLRAHLCGERDGLRPARVRVHVGGDGVDGGDGTGGGSGGGGAWRELADWPVAEGGAVDRWDLAPGGRLERSEAEGPVPAALGPAASDPAASGSAASGSAASGSAASGRSVSPPLAEFRYDPDDPTPSLGGPVLSRGAGRRDNRALEARADVLAFTGPELAEPLEVLGGVRARLRVTGTAATGPGRPFDVFARLCDVDGRGRSVHVCDGLVRVAAPGAAPGGTGEPLEVVVPMSAAAHRFAAGHRVRLQVSGGAFPRYALPPGAREAGPLRIAVHPGSALELPGSA
ncbi:peptidase S15 [Streptomyces sp. NRRL F-4489]|uniref:CocE/NonD family hydrolase n=1 Tax=Streptomyces sp. NRRL F-4489 TaxID=1609095 RepID=UPI0007489FF5|nr:CocE/NonD family hydrolase [Streptomyces sp. NRRL F-4489]KUL35662.1 peptidase S15 [Streptomyces sp. NRRL F-4489]